MLSKHLTPLTVECKLLHDVAKSWLTQLNALQQLRLLQRPLFPELGTWAGTGAALVGRCC